LLSIVCYCAVFAWKIEKGAPLEFKRINISSQEEADRVIRGLDAFEAVTSRGPVNVVVGACRDGSCYFVDFDTSEQLCRIGT
jgi:hypothetical protein